MTKEEMEKEARQAFADRKLSQYHSEHDFVMGYLTGRQRGGEEERKKLGNKIKNAITEIHDKDNYWKGMKILGDLVRIKFSAVETKVMPTTLGKLMKEES